MQKLAVVRHGERSGSSLTNCGKSQAGELANSILGLDSLQSFKILCSIAPWVVEFAGHLSRGLNNCDVWSTPLIADENGMMNSMMHTRVQEIKDGLAGVGFGIIIAHGDEPLLSLRPILGGDVVRKYARIRIGFGKGVVFNNDGSIDANL